MFRRYLKSATMTATGFFSDNTLFLADYMLRFLRVALLLSLWRMILAGRGVVSGMTLASVLTYTLIAEAFSEQLEVEVGLDAAFWNGDVVMRYLRPMEVVPQFASEMAGRWAVSFALFSLPLLLAAPLLGVNPLPPSAMAGALFAPSLLLAIMVGMSLDLLFGTLMLAVGMNMWTLGMLRNAVGTLLSGALLPLAFLPWGIGRVFEWLPFASMASAPLRIYTGTGDPFPLLAIQAGWAAVLWPLAIRLWHGCREKIVSYGG